MKRLPAAAGLLPGALALIALTTSVAASSQQPRVFEFTVVNGTGRLIMELFASPAKSGAWGDDVLGKEILLPGEKLDVAFSRNESTCSWRLKVVDEDKKEVEWRKLNLCEAREITLKYESGRPAATVK